MTTFFYNIIGYITRYDVDMVGAILYNYLQYFILCQCPIIFVQWTTWHQSAADEYTQKKVSAQIILLCYQKGP